MLYVGQHLATKFHIKNVLILDSKQFSNQLILSDLQRGCEEPILFELNIPRMVWTTDGSTHGSSSSKAQLSFHRKMHVPPKHHHHFWFYIRDKKTCVILIFNTNQNVQPVGRWKFNKQLKHNGRMKTKPGIFH